ncbi:hypothetical protein [Polaromonas sp. CG9_12]|nr:hypothetical protein [Polaromonas sp. CG9_12]
MVAHIKVRSCSSLEESICTSPQHRLGGLGIGMVLRDGFEQAV